jgi:hypothetical protein
MDAKIAALAPTGFWKLNESSGTTAADSSGFGNHMTTDGWETPLWGDDAGPPGEQAADFDTGASGPGGDASRVVRAWDAVTDSFTAGIWVSVHNFDSNSFVFGQGGAEWSLEVRTSALAVARLGGTGTAFVESLNPLTVDTWTFLVFVYDHVNNLVKLYVDGLLQGTDDATGILDMPPRDIWIGHYGDSGGGGSGFVHGGQFTGSYAFWVPSALTSTDLLDIVAADGEIATPGEGWVLTIGEGGEPVWTPPATSSVGNPVDDTAVWLPLYDADGTVVLDGDGNIIPTLIPI